MKTFSEKEALSFWEELKHHASYSFNLSHSLAYSFISYQTAWLKHYYPTEFISAALTYGAESEKTKLLKEAQRLGIEIVPPKIGISDPRKWIAKDGKLFSSFLEVIGIGEKSLDKIKNAKLRNDGGFFSNKKLIKGALKKALEGIKAFSDEIPDNIDDYFKLGITFNPKVKYKNFYSKFQNVECNELELLSGDIGNQFKAIELTNKPPLKDLIKCRDCEGRKNVKLPLPIEYGKYNIMIIGEMGDRDDFKTRTHFSDDVGRKILFPELKKHRFDREDFCYTNFFKCQMKKPTLKNIKTCGEWLKKEIENINPSNILAFGNSAMKFFENEEGGIFKANGKTKWVEEYSTYVTFCVSPSNVLYFRDDNIDKFRFGIKKFVEKTIQIGGFT